ncbi:MAG TPA: hypothetical protein VEH06_04475 [Candidatus Bathyarchaeia archaeon]|nr:hypothetical protein [Candidatus Bathyarchaeia archaeon]
MRIIILMLDLLDPHIQQAFAKHDANMTWYRNNYSPLKQKYEGQLILAAISMDFGNIDKASISI